jgi:DNA-binding NarL/FixJ family response regulator
MADKSRILIADDHHVVVEGIKTILSNKADFEVVGSAPDGQQAISMIKSLRPDVVILDVSMPNMDGVEAAHEIKTLDQEVKILVYTMSASKEHITALFKEGVSGYILKEEPTSELILGLQVLRKGATFYSKAVQEVLRDHVKALELGVDGKHPADTEDGIVELSAREKEVFVLLADGFTVKSIADRLCISPKTVESHKYNIMDKLNVKTLAELTKIAAKKHLIEI